MTLTLRLLSYAFDFIKKVHIRLFRNTSPLHGLSQILRLDKLPSLLHVIPLEEDYDFIRVIRAAEEMTPLATVGLPGNTVFIEHRFPLSIVYDFMSD
jgi:hypothetical protein